MRIKKFKYNGVERELFVMRESDTHIQGFDLSKIKDDVKRAEWRKVLKDVDFSQMDEETGKAKYGEYAELHGTFRNFKKSNFESEVLNFSTN